MRMKTYQAETLQEVFTAIKAEMGADAIILDTTHARTGRTLMHPFGRPVVRVQAAVDHAQHTPERRPPHAPSRGAESALPQAGRRAAIEGVFDRVLASSLQEHDDALDSTDARGEGDDVERERPVPVRAATIGAGPARMRAELEARGCEPATASRLMSDAIAEATSRRSLSDASLRAALHDVVTKRLRMRAPRVGGEGQAKCVAVIGPTGVGKTLALSKLIPQYLKTGGARVTVVKIEPERTPIVDALQITAVELGARLDIVRTQRELGAVLGNHGEDDVILIDTPGRNVRDPHAVGQWRAWLSHGSPVEVHLVLPALTVRQDFEDLMLALAGIPIHRLLFTKLDETDRHGRMVDIALQSALPVSYVTASQDPQGTIEVATPDRLAGLICAVGEGAEAGPAGRAECHSGTSVRAARSLRMPVAMSEGGVEWNRP